MTTDDFLVQLAKAMAGWIDLDPSSILFADDRDIKYDPPRKSTVNRATLFAPAADALISPTIRWSDRDAATRAVFLTFLFGTAIGVVGGAAANLLFVSPRPRLILPFLAGGAVLITPATAMPAPGSAPPRHATTILHPALPSP